MMILLAIRLDRALRLIFTLAAPAPGPFFVIADERERRRFYETRHASLYRPPEKAAAFRRFMRAAD